MWKGVIDMAEKLCELRKKGGGGGRYNETSLWTNPSPTSDFAGQEVTLSDSIENYKYIKINFAYATSYNTGKCNTSVVFSVDDFKNMTYSTNDRHNIGALSVQNQSNTAYNRILFYVSNTAVRFGTCYQQGTNTASNANSIPLEILGLNELDHGKRFDETTLWTNNAPTNTFAGQSVTISEDMDNFDYIKVKFRLSTTDATESSCSFVVSELKQFTTTSISPVGSIAGYTASSTSYARFISYESDTSIKITGGFRLNTSGSSNSVLIPTSIVGCKFK